jgi:predicted ribosomally synthesized peptide with SipW-like signal peptide
MGRKSSAKGQPPPTAPAPPEAPKRNTNFIVAGVAVLAVVVGTTAYWHQQSAADTASANADPTASAAVQYPQPITAPPADAKTPELQFPAYPTTRPAEVVRAAYQFAAQHPEVLSYVPCFCGCERAGHRGNEDCFVRERATNGDVIAWDDHGMECAICLDVADRSRKLFAEGKSVAEIRSAIEKEFSGHGPSHTPTPQPPAKAGS